jgi:hypothetical protein
MSMTSMIECADSQSSYSMPPMYMRSSVELTLRGPAQSHSSSVWLANTSWSTCWTWAGLDTSSEVTTVRGWLASQPQHQPSSNVTR